MSFLTLFILPTMFYSIFAASNSTQSVTTHTYTYTKRMYVRPTHIQSPSPTASTHSPTPRSKADQPLAETPQTSLSIQNVKTYIMNEINRYRTSVGLSSVTIDSQTCSFAKIRAKEISQKFNHDGFRNRIHTNTLPYPSYKTVTENIAQTSDFKKVVQLWIASSSHEENIRKDTHFVCVEQYKDYFAYEGLQL